MKWPMMNKYPLRTVTVPKLSGGVNLRDAVTLIKDNQLTECLNMWYKDGILKTRPSLYTNSNMSYDIYLKNEFECNAKPLDIFMTKSGRLYRLFQYAVGGEENQDNSVTVRAHNGVFWASGSDIISLPKINGSISFVTQFKDEIYVFTKGYSIYTMEINPEEDNPRWHPVSSSEIYVPKVAINCKTHGFDNVSVEYDCIFFDSTMFEGYNLLSSYYRMIYSTVNKDLLDLSDSSSTHIAVYGFLHRVDVPEFAGKKVKVTIQNGEGAERYEHEVTLTGTPDEMIVEQNDVGDGLYLIVWGNKFGFGTSTAETIDKRFGVYDYFENNMEVTAPVTNKTENLEKVFGMTESVWFGSDAMGLSGGTRLFLGGNENEKEKSLVVWSDLNRPTYFPENNYAYVGDTTQKVTAFGRQNDSLIIFKEREIFYTQYAQNSDITAEDLINQSVVDYAASSVYFPMVQLHAGIGCDCPRTVQLCRNYLVWAHSDGNIYTLRSQNQYSERNIYCVSDMISRSLKNNDLKEACAADFDGHYFLFVNGNVFVMDYNSYGFVNISGYSKTEDAQVLIPWWKWEIPFKPIDTLYSSYVPEFSVKCVSVLGNELCCVFYNAEAYLSNFIVCSFTGNGDSDTYKYGVALPIASLFKTKIFDFGAPHITKKVPLVNINFGGYDQREIKVSFITDSGTEKAGIVNTYGDNGDEYAADYVVNRQFRPSRFVTRFGVKIEREGKLAVDSISLDYRILGGVK